MSKISQASEVGIVVAGDFPSERWPDLEAGKVEPVELVFHYRRREKEPFGIPVRDLLPIEVIMVVNKALMQNKIEFGFRPKEGPPLVGTGH